MTSVAGLHSEGAEKVEEAGTEDVSLLERKGRADFLGAAQAFSLFRAGSSVLPQGRRERIVTPSCCNGPPDSSVA